MSYGGKLLTQQEAARELHVSVQTLRRFRCRGELPFYRLGYRTVRVRRDDLEEFKERRKRALET